jgi:hypothetical protein
MNKTMKKTKNTDSFVKRNSYFHSDEKEILASRLSNRSKGKTPLCYIRKSLDNK